MKRIREAEGRSGRETLVFLKGGDDEGKEDFEEGRFRQGNAFAYLTGVDTPGAWLVLWPNSEREVLYLSPPSGHPVMNGPSSDPKPGPEAANALGFLEVKSSSKLLGELFTAIDDPMRREGGPRRNAIVYTMNPRPAEAATTPEAKFVRFLRQGAPTTEFKDLGPIVGEMRKAKSPAELALLRRAIAITGQANEEVVKVLRPGLGEYQLEARVLGAFLDGGAVRPSFASIIGSGPNATIPHYFANSRTMEEGDLLVVDIGAEYKLYAADVTRTYPVGGTFTPRQREIYQLVLDAQSEAERHMKPGGARLGEMTMFVASYLKKSPLRAKDEAGREHTMDHFFIHGLGHYLGMDVHDVGDTFKPVQVGEVFTIEPGIYIRSENIGIRIEDDYLMTPEGPEKLSRGIPSDPAEIERRIAKARGVAPSR